MPRKRERFIATRIRDETGPRGYLNPPPAVLVTTSRGEFTFKTFYRESCAGLISGHQFKVVVEKDLLRPKTVSLAAAETTSKQKTQ